MFLALLHDPATAPADSREGHKLAASDRSESPRCFHHCQPPQVPAVLFWSSFSFSTLKAPCGFSEIISKYFIANSFRSFACCLLSFPQNKRDKSSLGKYP